MLDVRHRNFACLTPEMTRSSPHRPRSSFHSDFRHSPQRLDGPLPATTEMHYFPASISVGSNLTPSHKAWRGSGLGCVSQRARVLEVSCGIQLLASKLVVMSFIRCLAFHICAALLTCLPAAATNLVTGNGFGFAVVSPQTGMVTRFYAHPYSFVRPDPETALSEGVETANFIKSLGWRRPSHAQRIGRL